MTATTAAQTIAGANGTLPAWSDRRWGSNLSHSHPCQSQQTHGQPPDHHGGQPGHPHGQAHGQRAGHVAEPHRSGLGHRQPGLQHGTEHGEQRGLHQQEHRVRHDGDDDDRHQLCQAPDGDPQARHTPAPNVLDTHGDTTYQAGKVCKVGHDIRYSEVTD